MTVIQGFIRARSPTIGARPSLPLLATVGLLLSALVAGGARAEEGNEGVVVLEEDVFDTKVVTASGVPETVLNAPASITVINRETAAQRGYSNVLDAIYDLPGFDISLTNGTNHFIAYQRGYRTPWMQRTLLMIDGVVDNHLWSHVAEISRQYPLANVDRVEVLYGPASAVYGPNAFLGIINVVTRDGSELPNGTVKANVDFEAGSFTTYSFDAGVRGKLNDLHFALSGRLFRSDEPDLSDRWGFSSNDWYGNRDTWGPMLNQEHHNVKLGRYYDPTDDYGILASLGYKGLKLGLIHWVVREGFGPYYAADRIQNNVFWARRSDQLYAQLARKLSKRWRSKTLVLYRRSRLFGNSIEAVPDWREGMSDYSYINYADWNSANNSLLFKQSLEIEVTDKIQLLGGMKYERKELTKAYDIPGYWNAYSSTVPSTDPGRHGFGAGVGHSQDLTYDRVQGPAAEMPDDNLALTHDIGGFLLGIADFAPVRLNAGIRFDHNSIYGWSFNPRVTAMYRLGNKGAFKLLYAEAFQEPAPVQLFGGWQGRASNPNLKPEKSRTTEAIALYALKRVSGSLSVYYSHFDNVIMEDALNLGTRDVVGAELQVASRLPNPMPKSAELSLYANYSFAYVNSSKRYDASAEQWVDGNTELGDIAPHKVNFGLNVPLLGYFNLNVRGNVVSAKKLYAANPLRARGADLDAYLHLNLVLSARLRWIMASFKISNLLDAQYFHSGVERANAGDNFSERSLGFMNSKLPQPGRYYLIKLSAAL